MSLFDLFGKKNNVDELLEKIKVDETEKDGMEDEKGMRDNLVELARSEHSGILSYNFGIVECDNVAVDKEIGQVICLFGDNALMFPLDDVMAIKTGVKRIDGNEQREVKV